MVVKREKKDLSVRVGLPRAQYDTFTDMANILEFTNPTQIGRRLILQYMEEKREEYEVKKKAGRT